LHKFNIKITKTTLFALKYKRRREEVIKSGISCICVVFARKMKEIKKVVLILKVAAQPKEMK